MSWNEEMIISTHKLTNIKVSLNRLTSMPMRRLQGTGE